MASPSRYECPRANCGKSFSHSGHLNRHIRTHTGERNFMCTTCQRKFSRKSDLAVHEQTHRGAKAFACPECAKRFNTKTGLNSHKKIHGETSYACDMPRCEYTSPWKHKVTQHKKRCRFASPAIPRPQNVQGLDQDPTSEIENVQRLDVPSKSSADESKSFQDQQNDVTGKSQRGMQATCARSGVPGEMEDLHQILGGNGDGGGVSLNGCTILLVRFHSDDISHVNSDNISRSHSDDKKVEICPRGTGSDFNKQLSFNLSL